MPQDNLSKRLFFLMGSMPLCVLAKEPFDEEGARRFRELGRRLCARLESHPNVHLINKGSGEDGFSVEFGHDPWAPAGEHGDLDRGPWIFCQLDRPIVFQFHLPSHLQEKVWPWPRGDGPTQPEDFTVVYDGTIFVASAEVGEGTWTWPVPPTVRAYLQSELLASVEGFRTALIPPSPAHLSVLLKVRAGADANAIRGKVEYDQARRTLTLSDTAEGVGDLPSETAALYVSLRPLLRRFYSAMIDASIADGVYAEILEASRAAHEDYDAYLDTGMWHPLARAQARERAARTVAEMQYQFCEHSLILAGLQESRRSLLRAVSDNGLLRQARPYFDEMTRPTRVEYQVFRDAAEHLRSNLVTLSQNRYLLYAALLGAAITLLGTAVAHFLLR